MSDMYMHPDAREVVKLRENYVNVKHTFIGRVLHAYRANKHDYATLRRWLDTAVQDHQLIAEITAELTPEERGEQP